MDPHKIVIYHAGVDTWTGSGSRSPLELARLHVEVLQGLHGGRAALATVIARSGSAPQIAGASLLAFADHHFVGTVGGGAIEAETLNACARVLKTGTHQMVRHNLVRDLAMCCGGSMEIFVQYVQAETRLILVGAGHVAQAVATLAATLAYRVVVLDDREDLLAHPAFAQAQCLAYDADEVQRAIPDLGPRDHVLIVTRDHARDEKALAHLLEQPLAYLGMIGSRRKVHLILRRVLRRYDERQRPRPPLNHVHAPVGLALGGRTPAEIAVSICAQIIALQHHGNGTSMNEIDHLEQRASQEFVADESPGK